MQSQPQGPHAPIRHNSCHATHAAVPPELQSRSWVGTAAGSPATLCLMLWKMRSQQLPAAEAPTTKLQPGICCVWHMQLWPHSQLTNSFSRAVCQGSAYGSYLPVGIGICNY